MVFYPEETNKWRTNYVEIERKLQTCGIKFPSKFDIKQLKNVSVTQQDFLDKQ